MSAHRDLGRMALAILGEHFALEKKEIGADARLAKNGMVFETEVYSLGYAGQLCILRMKAMLGLMKMETVVVTPGNRDLPLINLDWVGVLGKETQIAELYDTQLAPYPAGALAEFDAVKQQGADLEELASEPHWYDAILYPCSFHKAGKGLSERFSSLAEGCLRVYAAQLAQAVSCDSAKKAEKNRAFAQRLFDEGGPAVDQVTKLFGRETAERLILRYMYGCA